MKSAWCWCLPGQHAGRMRGGAGAAGLLPAGAELLLLPRLPRAALLLSSRLLNRVRAHPGGDHDTPYRLSFLRPLAAARPVRHGRGPSADLCAAARPAYDASDPANANLAPVDRSPTRRRPCPSTQPPPPADGYIWSARLLEPEPQRLLLGAGRLGAGAVYRRAVDAGLLGFRGRHLSVARRLLGPHIGFYGGINYGFGYIGIGFVGGYWNHDRYFYNRAVTNVNVTHITNVYTHNVVVNNIDNRRISYNGGPNGIRRIADPREAAALKSPHPAHRRAASTSRARPAPIAGSSSSTTRAARRAPSWSTAPGRAPAPGPMAHRVPAPAREAIATTIPARSFQHRAASDQNPGGPGPRAERARRAAGPRGATSSPAGQAPPQVREQAPQPRMQRQERGPDNLAQPMHNERQRGRRWKRPARSRPARRR